jgi:hypothetical protein
MLDRTNAGQMTGKSALLETLERCRELLVTTAGAVDGSEGDCLCCPPGPPSR